MVEHKRPKLGTQNSMENSISTESRPGSVPAIVNFRRPRLDSSGSGQTSPTGGVAPDNMSLSSTSSPTKYPIHLEQSRSQGGSDPRYPSIDRTSSRGSDTPAVTHLPNISTLDTRVPVLLPGGLPPLGTSGPASRPSGPSQIHPRRLNQATPPFLRNDTISSISSSRSSNLSSGATMSSSSGFTPVTPIEENLYQKSIPRPTTSVGGGGPLGLSGDQSHQRKFFPPPVQKSQAYNPVSTLPYDCNSSPMADEYLKKDQLPPHHGTSYILGSPLYSRNNVTNGLVALQDIPGERRSPRELSLAGSPTAFQHDLRSHPYELHDAESQSSERTPQRLHDVFDQQAHNNERPPTARSPEGKSFLVRDDRSSDSAGPSRLDGLSVLALAGRLVGREARKPP